MAKLSLAQIQQIVNDARVAGLSADEVSTVEEWLLHDSASGQMTVGEELQLAIDTMETDQRDEIEAGIIGLQAFMSGYQVRVKGRLTEIDWSENSE
jgi:hypothetical protein